jgi:hypothetical protein
VDLIIDAEGNVRCIYDETLDLRVLGELSITRASHVEPTGDGRWTADLSPVSGPVLGPFVNRSAALRAELNWLSRHWLPTA